jgi:acyl-coenzyme A thioesterase PaaI-like protein
MNAGGVVHGGCLMSFADFSLFALGHEAMEGAYGVTVAFTCGIHRAARSKANASKRAVTCCARAAR